METERLVGITAYSIEMLAKLFTSFSNLISTTEKDKFKDGWLLGCCAV
jgi:hypothetical protein